MHIKSSTSRAEEPSLQSRSCVWACTGVPIMPIKMGTCGPYSHLWTGTGLPSLLVFQGQGSPVKRGHQLAMTPVPKTDALISLIFYNFQSHPQHSCGNLQGLASCGTNQILHSELPLHRLSMGLSHVTNRMFHCKWAAEWDMYFWAL